MSSATSTVVLAALVGVAQLWPMVAERPGSSFADDAFEAGLIADEDDRAREEESAPLDVAGDAPGQADAAAAGDVAGDAPGQADAAADVAGDTSGPAAVPFFSPLSSAGCATYFGPLSEKMTIIDLDPAGGCVMGLEPENAVILFAGGSDSTCKPPAQYDGCHRYIVSRYSEECNMSPLEDTVGQNILLTGTKETTLFGQDGVLKLCNKAGLLQSRTLLYIGAGGDSKLTCNEDACGCNDANSAVGCVGHAKDDILFVSLGDESVATRSSAFWVIAAAITSWVLLCPT